MVKKHLFISGRPGIGKTTLIRKLTEYLEGINVDYSGFITEELRERGKRVGFILKVVPGEVEGILAHIDFVSSYRVGKYGVNLDEFERIALPAIKKRASLLVIDEIGTMELYSFKFKEILKNLLKGRSPLILATIGEKHLPLLDKWKVRSNVTLMIMDYRNRDEILERTIRWIRENLEASLASN